MAKINLLPWREEYRQEKKKEFLGIIGFFVATALLTVFLWDRWVNHQIDNQNSRNQLLTREIAVLDKQVKEIAQLKKRKQDLIERMNVIQALQGNRPDVVRVFDELVKTIPDGLYLSSLTRTGDRIALTGYAESNNRVSAFMRNLDSSYKFSEPNLTKVVADGRLGEQGNSFEMRVKVTKETEKKAEVEGA